MSDPVQISQIREDGEEKGSTKRISMGLDKKNTNMCSRIIKKSVTGYSLPL